MAHFLIVSFPIYSHVIPTHECAKRLAAAGSRVTFATSISVYRRILRSPAPPGVFYASFSDGFDDGLRFLIKNDSSNIALQRTDDGQTFALQLKEASTQSVRRLALDLAAEGHPITCVVYGMNQIWIAEVAGELRIPVVCLWIQPAAVFAVYHHCFIGDHEGSLQLIENDEGFALELPRLPPLMRRDLPTLLLPSDPHAEIRSAFKHQLQSIDAEAREGGAKPRLLFNTFDALEAEALESVRGVEVITIGPLVPTTSIDDSSSYVQWLDSKPASSVVYVSFGSILAPRRKQTQEILNGLLESERPFLWVSREPEEEFETEMMSQVGASMNGLVVEWCSQAEVLAHPSTGCFVTHCGWNSTLEGLSSGIPMVCFPHWSDQTTNGKLVEDVWKCGMRVKVNEEGILESRELKRCIEEVMSGDHRGVEIKNNSLRWKELAREAVEEGGTSDRHIKELLEQMGGSCCL